jgi:predicted nucleotidyltransferase
MGRLNLPMSDLLYAVRVGSHLHGTATPDSDTDIYVVLRSGADKLVLDLDGRYDVSIKSQARFFEAVTRPSMYALEAYYAPPEHALYGTPPIDTRTLPGNTLIVRLKPLLDHVKAKSDADYSKGALLLEYNEDKARKKVWHSIRLLMYAQQIEAHGLIADYEHPANCHYLEIMTDPLEGYIQKWGQVRRDLLDNLYRTVYPTYSRAMP